MNKYFPGMCRVEYRPDASPEETMVFRHYNASETVYGRPMEEWLKFSVCYFNTFSEGRRTTFMQGRYHDDYSEGRMMNTRHEGKKTSFSQGRYHDDYSEGRMMNTRQYQGQEGHFGDSGHHQYQYEEGPQSFDRYKRRLAAAFEFFHKLGVKYYSVSDRDLAPEGYNFDDTNSRLEEAVSLAVDMQRQTGVRPLYFGCDLFSHPRYVHGAAASPDAHVFAYACAQVKRGLEAAKRLGAENFIFFHPRDGYESLLQRQPLRDASHLAQLYRMASSYRDKIGYKGQMLIQPRPAGPRRHQYEADASSCMHLLRHFGLDKQYKLNIRPASSRLMMREPDHDVRLAASYEMLGSIDIADGFPAPDGAASDICAYDVRDATLIMKCVLEMGGLGQGGFTLGGRVRRCSVEPKDLFEGHVLAMDTFARALRNAARMMSEGVFSRCLQQRYSSYKSGLGERIERGSCTLEECEDYIRKAGEPQNMSGRYEHFQAVFNHYVYPPRSH